VGTENEQFYLNFDCIDILLDGRSVEDICDPDNLDLILSKGFGLTTTTKQYQVACGTKREKALGFIRSLGDPWDFNPTYYTFEDASERFGLQIENIKTDYFYKAQEWFIPWSEIGGLSSEPDAGSRIAFSGGYNDRDAGEHFPPGVNTSGGSVKASAASKRPTACAGSDDRIRGAAVREAVSRPITGERSSSERCWSNADDMISPVFTHQSSGVERRGYGNINIQNRGGVAWDELNLRSLEGAVLGQMNLQNRAGPVFELIPGSGFITGFTPQR
jgi:hypothetical protein